MHIFWKVLEGQEFKQFIDHASVLRAHTQNWHVQALRQFFDLRVSDRRIFNQVYLCLYQKHGYGATFLLYGFFPLFHVVEALSVSSGKSYNASGGSFVVAASEWVVLLLAGSIPYVELNLLAQLLNKVFFLQEVHAQSLLVLLQEEIFDEFGDQTCFANLYMVWIRLLTFPSPTTMIFIISSMSSIILNIICHKHLSEI